MRTRLTLLIIFILINTFHARDIINPILTEKDVPEELKDILKIPGINVDREYFSFKIPNNSSLKFSGSYIIQDMLKGFEMFVVKGKLKADSGDNDDKDYGIIYAEIEGVNNTKVNASIGWGILYQKYSTVFGDFGHNVEMHQHETNSFPLNETLHVHTDGTIDYFIGYSAGKKPTKSGKIGDIDEKKLDGNGNSYYINFEFTGVTKFEDVTVYFCHFQRKGTLALRTIVEDEVVVADSSIQWWIIVVGCPILGGLILIILLILLIVFCVRKRRRAKIQKMKKVEEEYLKVQDMSLTTNKPEVRQQLDGVIVYNKKYDDGQYVYPAQVGKEKLDKTQDITPVPTDPTQEASPDQRRRTPSKEKGKAVQVKMRRNPRKTPKTQPTQVTDSLDADVFTVENGQNTARQVSNYEMSTTGGVSTANNGAGRSAALSDEKTVGGRSTNMMTATHSHTLLPTDETQMITKDHHLKTPTATTMQLTTTTMDPTTTANNTMVSVQTMGSNERTDTLHPRRPSVSKSGSREKIKTPVRGSKEGNRKPTPQRSAATFKTIRKASKEDSRVIVSKMKPGTPGGKSKSKTTLKTIQTRSTQTRTRGDTVDTATTQNVTKEPTIVEEKSKEATKTKTDEKTVGKREKDDHDIPDYETLPKDDRDDSDSD